MSQMQLGTNVKAEVKGTILTITVDLSEKHGLSSSGKNTIIASTGGNQLIPGTTVKIGLNAFTK